MNTECIQDKRGMNLWAAVGSSENAGGPLPSLGRETFATLTRTARARVRVPPAPALEMKTCVLAGLHTLTVQDQSNRLHEALDWLWAFPARSHTRCALPPEPQGRSFHGESQSFRNAKWRGLATFKSVCTRQLPKEITGGRGLALS